MATEKSNLQNSTDEELMELVLNRNHQAFSELVNRHAKRFYSIAYRTLYNKNDAEDIVQDSFLKLWDNPKMWRVGGEAKFTTWFYKVVMNRALDYNRKKRPVSLGDDFDPADESQDVERDIDEKRKLGIVDRYFRELPKAQQTAINLCFYHGISNQEAADIMNIKLKALQSLLIRGKTALREKATKILKG